MITFFLANGIFNPFIEEMYLFQKNYQLAMNKEVKGFVFNPMLEQVFNINTMSK